MKTLSLSSGNAILASNGDLWNFKLISKEIVEEWRWGNIYESIIQDVDGNFWGVTYKIQVGDNYHNELEDEDTVEFYPLVAKEVTTTVYERVKV